MKNDFLSYYNNELSFLRASGSDFGKANPKIAGHLSLNHKGFEDPHVARLIESFAFLTARIHRKIDDDLPELADALLDVLYPHYLLPVPSLSIVQFNANPNATGGYLLPNKTDIENSSNYGHACQFTTCYDVMLYPIEITHIELIEKSSTLFSMPSATQSVLEIQLRCIKPKLSFTLLKPESVRFFINLASPHAYLLYELLFRNTLNGFIVDESNNPIPFSSDNIQAVGFDNDQGLFPYPEQSNLNYRLLTEFFVYPEKFLFFDIFFKDDFLTKNNFGREMKIVICFDESMPNLRAVITHTSLALHCTPIVNLFEVQSEPILVDHTQNSYPIIPDARQLNEFEIYKVNAVSLSDQTGRSKKCLPLYGFQENNEDATYWQIQRKNRAELTNQNGRVLDMHISFVQNEPSLKPSIAQASLLCTNHQLPSELPYGGGHPNLQLINEHSNGAISCLRPFTTCYHLPIDHGVRWQLISHLMLNTFSFSNDAHATKFLHELLQLYNFSNTPENVLFINNIVNVETKPITARGPRNYGNTIFSGTEVSVTVARDHPSLFLFTSVLEKFLASYCAINSFTQLILKYTHKPGEQIQWKPAIGSKALL